MTAKEQSACLEAKVTGRNKVNALFNHWTPILRAALAPLVGLDIYNQDGTLKKKIRDGLPVLPNTVATQILWNHGTYSIGVRFKVCIPYGDHFCIYAERIALMGELKGVRLVKLYDQEPTARENWTASDVIRLRNENEEAQRRASRALDAISDFGLHDNS